MGQYDSISNKRYRFSLSGRPVYGEFGQKDPVEMDHDRQAVMTYFLKRHVSDKAVILSLLKYALNMLKCHYTSGTDHQFNLRLFSNRPTERMALRSWTFL